MPYIDPRVRKQRARLDPHIEELAREIVRLVEECGEPFEVAGLLNYCFTRILMRATTVRRYWMFALIKGVLGDVRDEFRRRIVDPYEDKCIARNGDIPEYAKE
jgi:hypothetical protein